MSYGMWKPELNENASEENSTLLQLPGGLRRVDWRMSKLQQFIEKEEGRIGWRLADVCQKLDIGVTASHASRLFRQEFGLSIREYKKLKRLHAAAARLRTTSLSAKQIAADLGYGTPADFFRQFKNFYQVTPRKFRSMTRVDI